MKNNLTRWDRFDRSMDSFGNVFDGFFRPFFSDGGLMRTDVRETDKEYLMDIEMPGYDKKDIGIDIDEGYVTVKAGKEEKDEKRGEDRYLFRERSAVCSRRYYVGDFDEDGVKAKYEDGVLKITLPKREEKPVEKHSIEIE